MTEQRTPALELAPRPAGLRPDQCTIQFDPTSLNFTTTAEVEVLESVIEQDRALKALDLGLAIQRPNYHLYVAGASGTGKRSQLRALLGRLAPTRPVPADWVYVHNFEDHDAPVAISLPAGRGVSLRKDIDELLAHLRTELPKLYQGRDTQESLQRTVYIGNTRSNDAFLALRRKSREAGFEVRTSDDGDLLTLPIIDGEPVEDEDLLQLPDEVREAVERQREQLEPFFTDFVQTNRAVERETSEALRDIARNVSEFVARNPMRRLRRRYRDGGDKMKAYLKGLYDFFLENTERFMGEDEPQSDGPRGPDRFVAFRVRVVVDNSKTEGAPVIFETHPTFYRMFGKIERRVEQGIYFTDHTMIRAGSLLQANGGFLVCHAVDLFSLPGVWENLKTTLRNREVAIEDLGEHAGLLPTSGLKPEPIPISLKLILIGSNTLYHAVYRAEGDFRKTFQVKADFDDEIRRNDVSVDLYVRFIATATKNNGCRPLDPGAVAAVIEYGSRQVDSQKKLTLRFNSISNVLVEAEYHANLAGAPIISKAHVATAIHERQERSSLIADKMHEDLLDGQLLLSSHGRQIGVINGLAVLSVGEHDFGRPYRITARCFAGQEGIVNIEHEANMSGELHDKGVQILAGFLGHRFARERPLALTATVTFEQSYGLVDGDSASSTWLCGILSALSGVPVDQGLGVTGSVNQLGEIQPIGGVNHKIEGFYRFCAAGELTGEQGVVIPWQNAQHLMLSEEVRQAIAAGRFHVWPVKTIDEAIERVTGVKAGTRNAAGNYGVGTVMYGVQQRIDKLREHLDEPAVRADTRAPRRGTAESRRRAKET